MAKIRAAGDDAPPRMTKGDRLRLLRETPQYKAAAAAQGARQNLARMTLKNAADKAVTAAMQVVLREEEMIGRKYSTDHMTERTAFFAIEIARKIELRLGVRAETGPDLIGDCDDDI